jgi:transposase
MRVEERLAQLEAENAELREQISRLLGYGAENAALRERVSHPSLQLADLEGRLAKDSHNSSKPPSSDGLGHQRRSQHKGSEKKSGGQGGHMGHSLPMAEQPDKKVIHGPSECVQCHTGSANGESPTEDRWYLPQ